MIAPGHVTPFLLLATGLVAQHFVVREPTMTGDPAAGPNRVVIDIDGDGDLDLLTGSSGYRSYRNEGRGRFTFLAASAPTFLIGQVHPQAVGDYDGDGLDDICVAGQLLRNQGNGTFGPGPNVAGGFLVLPQSPTAFLDHDGDGDLDLLVGAGNLYLYTNAGNGNFTNVTATVLAGFDLGVQEFRVVDLDGDNDLDVAKVAGGFGPMTVEVWRNQGQGQFAVEKLPAPAGLGVVASLRIADFTGDGNPDLAVTASGLGSGSTCWLLDRASGSWVATLMNIVANELLFADAGDWDGDGRADWVTLTGVHVQTGPLQFAFQPFAEVMQGERSLLVDLDGDRRLDVLAHGGNGFVRNRRSGALFSERPFVVGGATAPQSVQSRPRAGSAGDVELLSIGQGYLRWGTDTLLPGDSDRRLRLIRSTGPVQPPAALVTSPTPGAPPGIISLSGPVLFEVINGALVAQPGPVMTVPPSRVAAADLDGQPGDELVFGVAGFAGPRIFTRTTTGFADITPTLLPAPISNAPCYEQVTLVDCDDDGDLDILHELRWLRNDGGVWVDAVQFGTLVPPATSSVVPLDVDGDGDQDLFLIAGGANRLLRNTGTAFVDVSSTWLAGPLPGGIVRAQAGDVDRDGLVDLLVVTQTNSHLLRNDGAAFQWLADVGPAGWLADLNHDDRPDLFVGDRVLWNRHTLLRSTGPALLGSWRLELETRRALFPVLLASLLLGDAESVTMLPGIGTLGLDPNNLAVFDLPLAGDTGSIDLPIPDLPAAIGFPLRAQAVTWDGPGLQLSNVVRDRVR